MFAKIVKISISSLILLSIALGAGYWMHYSQLHPSTNDAYVQAHTANIAPQVTGLISQVLVQNHEKVSKGQLLFTIDPTPFKVAFQKAQANLQETRQSMQALQAQIKAQQSVVTERQAELINTQKESKRTLALVKKNYFSQASGDAAISKLKVAQAALTASQNQLEQTRQQLGKTGNDNAQMKEAQAAVKSALLNLTYTKVYAPADGYLANLTLQPGNPVTAYQGLFSIVKTNNWWISANFKETHLDRIKVGQPVTIELDMYPNHVFHGHVASFNPGSGTSFALLPPENATGNWVKVTQRFPVWINVDDTNAQYPFLMGASCTVTVNTTVFK